MDNIQKLKYYTLDSMGLLHLKKIFSNDKINDILNSFLKIKQQLKCEECEFVKKYVGFEQIQGIIDIFTNANILDVCKNCIGQDFKLDYMVLVEQTATKQQKNYFSVHGGSHKHYNLFYYHSYPQEHIDNPCYTQTGQLTVGIPLTDQNNVTGGFCYLPGSHKSSYHIYSQPFFEQCDQEELKNYFIIPSLHKGDCIIFPENLTHGQTLYCGDMPRYTIYAAYYPISMQFNKDGKQRTRLYENIDNDQKVKIYPQICERKNLHNASIF